jgi:hypothetical protein
MSALDPALGTHNSWRGDKIERSPVPTLYQSEGSYYSQLARLCLVEKGLPWKSRLLDLHSVALDQARQQPRNRLAGVQSACGRPTGHARPRAPARRVKSGVLSARRRMRAAVGWAARGGLARNTLPRPR